MSDYDLSDTFVNSLSWYVILRCTVPPYRFLKNPFSATWKVCFGNISFLMFLFLNTALQPTGASMG